MKKIHVIAPASSAKEQDKSTFSLGENCLKKIGYEVTYGEHLFDLSFMQRSGSIKNRINDWNNAWKKDETDYVLTFKGGTNSNQILDYIDWKAIQNNNKILIGHSDITVLANALYRKNKKVSFLGINFSCLCRESVIDYTLENLQKALIQNKYRVLPSEKVNISEDPAIIIDSEGWWKIQEGEISGVVIGGNLPSFRLLYGTEYMPSLFNSVVFIEWDNFTNADIEEFDRELEALTMQKDFSGVRGLVIGRFQANSKVSKDNLIQVIQNKKQLSGMPIVANVDFGHTAPTFIFPVGGNVYIENEFRELIFSYDL